MRTLALYLSGFIVLGTAIDIIYKVSKGRECMSSVAMLLFFSAAFIGLYFKKI